MSTLRSRVWAKRSHTSGASGSLIVELQAILAIADPEWRSPILFGLYTGQRLSDLVSLTWNNIDLERGEVRLVTSKTSRLMIIPMAPLRSHIESVPAGDNPQAPLRRRNSR
jgi:integrase